MIATTKEEAIKIMERLTDRSSFNKEEEDRFEEFLKTNIKWKPKNKDLKWTEETLKTMGDKPIGLWVTSWGIVFLFKESKMARIIEINHLKNQDSLEEMGRLGKAMKTLGWYVDMPCPIINYSDKNGKRWIPGIGDISGVKIPTGWRKRI